MRVRDYFGSFFTREYWSILGDFLLGAAFASRTIRKDFWDRHDAEVEEANAAAQKEEG